MSASVKIAGMVKEEVAEVIGDGKLAEKGKDQQREPRIPTREDMPPADPKPRNGDNHGQRSGN